MLYVQQSLGPNEEILLGARFHWMYTVKALMWVLMGLTLGVSLAYAAIWWDIDSTIRGNWPDLPEHLYPAASEDVLKQKEGYLAILWSLSPLLRMSILGLFVFGLFLFAHLMIVKATTEIGITTERLIYKRGLIARHVGELSVDRIEGVTLMQGVFGRVFGYGRVSIRGMGVGEVILPPIEDPLSFQKAINEAKSIQETGGIPAGGIDSF